MANNIIDILGVNTLALRGWEQSSINFGSSKV